MLALEGKQLGNYVVGKRIRAGGMGAVYEGKQRTAFDRRVAIKVILGDYAADREMRRRFAREARTIARLHHPHILPLIEFGDERGILYLVMPFIEGGTLTNYLHYNIPDLGEVSDMFQQLLDAVEYAHDEGLIHRDIKSSNVLLEMRRNGSPYAYLADFGLVRMAQQSDYEQEGKLIPLDQVPGTPHYMAPEQTWGVVTAATDIYALGVLLFQMLTGKLPYDDDDEIKIIEMHLHAPIPSPGEHDISIPPALCDVVRTAMAKRAEDRYRTVAEMRAAFLTAIQEPFSPTIPDEDVEAPAEKMVPRPLSMPLLPLDGPEPQPMPLPRRPPRVATEALARERVRTTDSIRERPRTTASVIGRTNNAARIGKTDRHKRLKLSIVAGAIVPAMLLVLLIMPRLLGVSLFPVGFPVFGTDPVATVSITPDSQMQQNTFLFTASAQVQQPDSANRIIPDRRVTGIVAGSSLTQTTGSQVVVGTQAQGMLLFVNNTHEAVPVAAGTTFTTISGVLVRTTQAVEVPARANKQDGFLKTTAVAVNPGASGNIAANVLSAPCCNGLTVSNPSAFSGGVDARTIQLVAQADLDHASAALRSGLQRQALQNVQQQLHTNEVMVGQPVYTATVTSDQPVGAAATQVRVQVTLSASVTVYDHSVVQNIAVQLLSKQVAKTLGSDYRLQGVIAADISHVVQPGTNGPVYLSVTVHGLWDYYFSPQVLAQWSDAIKGTSSSVALAYLNSRPGVSAVEIHLPFGTDHFPAATTQIKITFAQ